MESLIETHRNIVVEMIPGSHQGCLEKDKSL